MPHTHKDRYAHYKDSSINRSHSVYSNSDNNESKQHQDLSGQNVGFERETFDENTVHFHHTHPPQYVNGAPISVPITEQNNSSRPIEEGRLHRQSPVEGLSSVDSTSNVFLTHYRNSIFNPNSSPRQRLLNELERIAASQQDEEQAKSKFCCC